MPNRILRDWTDSYTMEPISAYGERLFGRLIMKADDFGRYHADPRLIRAGCFPLLIDLRDTDITHWIAECEKAGLILVYQVGGRSYLAIRNFKQRARADTSKFPPPDGKPPDWRPEDDRHVTVTGPPYDSHPPARASNTNTNSNSPPKGESEGGRKPPDQATPRRLNGIPSSVDEVIAFGKALPPPDGPVAEDRCRAFWAHYEGQARTGPNGDVFWVTSGEAIVTNWKAKLPSFSGVRIGQPPGKAGGRAPTITELRTVLQMKEEKAKAIKEKFASEGPLSIDWSDESKRQEWATLRKEIKELKERIERSL